MNDGIKRVVNVNLIWLFAGCVLLLFMGGKWNVPVTVWIGSIFFVRYFRARRSVWEIPVALPFIFAASHVFFIGLAEQVTVAFKIIVASSYTLYIVIPCLADRFLHHRIGSRLLSTLVYPAALVAVQFLLSFLEPIGTTLNWTGALFSMKPLIQLVSVTGVWGPSFLVGWLASVTNLLWEEGFDLRQAKVPATAFAGVMAVVLAGGGASLAFFGPAAGTVKAGSVVVGLPEDNYFYAALELPAEAWNARRDELRRATREVQDGLLAESDRLAAAGAKIICWGSGNAAVFREDYAALVERLRNFARRHNVWFFPCPMVLDDESDPDMNRVLAIRPDGEIAYTHFKGRNPNAGHFRGDELPTVDTPYGRIASPICYEMEFHRFIRQASAKGVDILIVPGDEPARAVAVTHTEISAFRALENGCAMLRTTLEGLTLGLDWQGRELARMDFYATLESRSVVAELPVKGRRTIYGALGDWFAWLCVLSLAAFVFIAVHREVRGGHHGKTSERFE